MVTSLWNQLLLLSAFARRDYAVQFAGTSLGILWPIIQYVFQVAIFYIIFGFLFSQMELPGRGIDGMDYLSYLLGGMAVWLPVSEMLLRSCSILTENRSLIRRTDTGYNVFLRIPVFQAFIHYSLITALVIILGLLRGTLQSTALIALPIGFTVILFMAGWAFILARISVILKDLTPVLRMLLQVAFWATPIVYFIPEDVQSIWQWNPFYHFVYLHRNLLFLTEQSYLLPEVYKIIGFIAISLLAFYLSRFRLNEVIQDQI